MGQEAKCREKGYEGVSRDQFKEETLIYAWRFEGIFPPS